jgi:hypothetical protein
MQINDLRQLYPGFDDIYQRHVNKAKFETIKGADFRSLKERLAFLCHLLGKHQKLGSEKRAELIQALISECDLHHAQQVIPKCEKNKESGVFPLLSKVKGIIFSGPKDTDEDSLQKEMKKIAKSVSDSDFLHELKSVDDEDLQSPIQEAVVLARTQLSSSIDVAVKKMTHSVLRMQQSYCKKSVRLEIEAEERILLGDALVAFIRDINICSAGRKNT